MNHIRRKNYLRTHLLFLVQNIYRKDFCASGQLQEWNLLQEADHRVVAGSEQEHPKILVPGIGKAGNSTWVLEG